MEILNALLYIINEMSPYILFGFFIAGLLHAFVPEQLVGRHLAGRDLKSIAKSALIGVPLPLCSCGVLPTAVALRRGGASKGATASFLIATPQTGVDSVAATWSLLGPWFAVIRPVAALVTALCGGMLVARTERNDAGDESVGESCPVALSGEPRGFMAKMRSALIYGFHTLVRSIGKWLVVGLVIAAAITVFVPDGFFTALNGHTLPAMLAAVAVAVPMYVCATGSIPIALSLMLKGVSPGTAFVLLMAGPAVNLASIMVIGRTMGRRAAAAYIGSIVAGAILFGLVIDRILPAALFAVAAMPAEACHHSLPVFATVCSAILVLLLIAAFAAPLFKKTKPITEMTTIYRIKGMSCPHCQATVEKNLRMIEGVTDVTVDLQAGTAAVEGEHSTDEAIARIVDAGFDCKLG